MDTHDAFPLHAHTHSIHKNDRIEQPSLSTAHKNAHQGTLSHMQLLGRDGEEGWQETGKSETREGEICSPTVFSPMVFFKTLWNTCYIHAVIIQYYGPMVLPSDAITVPNG